MQQKQQHNAPHMPSIRNPSRNLTCYATLNSQMPAILHNQLKRDKHRNPAHHYHSLPLQAVIIERQHRKPIHPQFFHPLQAVIMRWALSVVTAAFVPPAKNTIGMILAEACQQRQILTREEVV